MACNLSITMYNMMPERPSEGVHVPFQTIIMDPFERPFTFGPDRCDVKNGSHIGLESKETVAGAFVGSDGEFLVMSDNQFIIFTPKSDRPVTTGAALFPKAESHEFQLAEKGKSYAIKVGSCIMTYSFESTPHLKTVTFFLGVSSNIAYRDEIYRSALGAMAQSLVYFNKIWQSVSDKSKKTVSMDLFKTEPSTRERFPDMKIIMHSIERPCIIATHPASSCNLPTIKTCQSSLPNNKRQKTSS